MVHLLKQYVEVCIRWLRQFIEACNACLFAEIVLEAELPGSTRISSVQKMSRDITKTKNQQEGSKKDEK
jgi:hypothetical protein